MGERVRKMVFSPKRDLVIILSWVIQVSYLYCEKSSTKEVWKGEMRNGWKKN